LFQSTGLLTICYPYVSLEPIVTRLSAQNWIDATKKKNVEKDRTTNVHNVKQVQAQMAAILLRSKLKMRDFLELKLGDIVPSEMKLDEAVEITVNRRKKFYARPGLAGKKRAFQVLEVRDNIAEEMRND
jgi:flagellar motor switch protein FliM